MMANSGQDLWQRAKKLIPGGNMLLSKRPEMFLPDLWPAYFSKCKGCYVWDLDSRKYIDFSIMGIGTNTLGYGNDKVDDAVRSSIDSGNMSTFNCPEEVELAERLTQMHSWADMARFARSGGEANAISVRIARAASEKDGVAICGYHGWHDWYLAANLADEKHLDGHLLPGLTPNGVPRNLKGSVYPFSYNDIDGLRRLISEHDIGVVKMEVVRNLGPQDHFLQSVRDLCDEKNMVLIFDECTSGFRATFGGIHKKFGVSPDIATFGKALGNGYAISAVIGKREIMENAQTTFISSTFWTEKIGPAAALATLAVMESEKSWEQLDVIGQSVKAHWRKCARRHDLPITISGINAIPNYLFDMPNNQMARTFVTQNMLDLGFLSTPLLYVSIAHTEQDASLYFEALDESFCLLRACLDNETLEDSLRGPVCHTGFARLN